MSKELTDEDVALALGYTLNAGEVDQWWYDNGRGFVTNLPKFTTSLDAITGEIERRERGKWECGRTKENTHWAELGPRFYVEASTAPLALCRALIAYLEEE